MATIPTQPVNSSNVAEIGHDPTTNTLAVKYQNGGLYYYGGVPTEKFEAMKKSSSIGRFLHLEIKGKHQHERIDETDD